MNLGAPLSSAEAALFEDAVVPRYLSYFGGLVAEMMLPCAGARIAHLGCRTGYPDSLVAEKLPGCAITGVDPSDAALNVARGKATLFSDVQTNYVVGDAFPLGFSEASFTHAFSVHPLCDAGSRSTLLAELLRLVIPGGQVLLSLPLRGSFPEINDMIREYALRQDLTDLGAAVDAAAASRPTIETVSEELENAGMSEVDVDVQLIAVSFANGREFIDDPIAKMMVFNEMRLLLPVDKELIGPCFRYVQEAISKYWSEGVFELTVNVGGASGRKF
jgi:ubiquinone/menaquinone biosynthesis C-methylase UbiE